MTWNKFISKILENSIIQDNFLIRRDFEVYWDKEKTNYDFPSNVIEDACKQCAYNAWLKSYETYN